MAPVTYNFTKGMVWGAYDWQQALNGFVQAAGSPVLTTLTSQALQATFGSGCDGNVTITSPTGLARNMQYNNVTISGAGSIFCNGFVMQIAGTLDLSDAGANAITISGAVAYNGGWNSSTPWSGGYGNSLYATNLSLPWTSQWGIYPVTPGLFSMKGKFTAAGGDGAHGTTGATVGYDGANENDYPVYSDACAGGGNGGNTISPSNNSAAGGVDLAGYIFFIPEPIFPGPNFPWGTIFQIGWPGSGGGGGGCTSTTTGHGGGGGAGGNGGGQINLFANIIQRGNNTTAGIISSTGGNGGHGGDGTTGGTATGGGGGGGGACGGLICITAGSLLGNAIPNAIDVSGGAGGNGGNGSIGGLSNGYGGRGGTCGIYIMIDLSTGVISGNPQSVFGGTIVEGFIPGATTSGQIGGIGGIMKGNL